MDAWLCKSCGHEDLDRDPKTREIIGPTHVTLEITKAMMVAESVPNAFTSSMGAVEYCLLCMSICTGEYAYEVMP